MMANVWWPFRNGSNDEGRGGLGCLFLQESSGFLFFPLLWRFFHRNHDSCSAVTFSERHQETCLYGAYVESYVGYQFVYSTMASVHHHRSAASIIATPPLLRRHHHCHPHCCAAIAIAIAAPPKLLLRRLSRRCTAIAVTAPPLPLLHCHHHCCATTFSAIAAPISAPPLLRRKNGDRRRQQWRRRW